MFWAADNENSRCLTRIQKACDGQVSPSGEGTMEEIPGRSRAAVVRKPEYVPQQKQSSTGEVGRLELIRESLVAVVNEMRASLIHSSYSSIIYEGHDFSCALIAADGRLVTQSLADHPIHIFAVPYSAAEVLKKFGDDINQGDIFLHNDPYTGGTHLNDILMLYPVFYAGRLVLFAAARCHWGDVGGMTPGSLSGQVREIYQEGIRITPTRICQRGRLNEEFLSLMFDNMRIPDERRGDFNAMFGTSRKAGEHLERLFRRYDGMALIDGVEELIARSEAVMRRRIAEVPDGVYLAEGYLDSDGHSKEPVLGRLKLTVHGDMITADFSGSSPQTRGPLNIGPAMALNSVATVVKSFLDPHSFINHGSFKPIKVINPPGSFLNALHPAPCGGMAECRALVTALVVTALGQALPHKRVGDLKGSANHLYLSGPRPGGGNYLMYEYPAGGTGASLGVDGTHGVRAFNEGDFNAVWAVEVVESQCPIQVEHYGIREGSCGDGEFRGGCGIRRDLRVLRDRTSLSVLSDHCAIPPFGVAKGKSAAANRFSVLRNGQMIEVSPIPGKIGGFDLMAGDVVRVETAGGGGYGDPLNRDISRVMADMTSGLLTADQARRRYGVVIDTGGGVDAAGTKAARKQQRLRRVQVRLRHAPTDAFIGNRRCLQISRKIAASLEIQQGDLIEAVTDSSGATLRGWAEIGAIEDQLPIGPRGMAILGANPGDLVELRAVLLDPA
jgi:N-methylhydantoinase B